MGDCFEMIASIDRDEDGDATGFYEWTNDSDVPYTNTDFFKKCCVGYEGLKKYIGEGFVNFYGWHISDLVIYDEPREITYFIKPGALCYYDWLYGIYDGSHDERLSYDCYLEQYRLKKAPQSWCYVENL